MKYNINKFYNKQKRYNLDFWQGFFKSIFFWISFPALVMLASLVSRFFLKATVFRKSAGSIRRHYYHTMHVKKGKGCLQLFKGPTSELRRASPAA